MEIYNIRMLIYKGLSMAQGGKDEGRRMKDENKSKQGMETCARAQ